MVDTCIIPGIHTREDSTLAKDTVSAQWMESYSYNVAFGSGRINAWVKFSWGGLMELSSTLVAKRTAYHTAGVFKKRQKSKVVFWLSTRAIGSMAINTAMELFWKQAVRWSYQIRKSSMTECGNLVTRTSKVYNLKEIWSKRFGFDWGCARFLIYQCKTKFLSLSHATMTKFSWKIPSKYLNQAREWPWLANSDT